MNPKIPKRLQQEPLIEAIWQIQFEPVQSQSVAEILPGIVFTALRNEQPELKLHRLPPADMPPVVVQNDPNLRSAAKYRIHAPDWPFLIQIGDRVVTINCQRPYVGWTEFQPTILELIDLLEKSDLIPQPQRHSLRYIDLLTLEEPPALNSIQLSLTIGDHVIDSNPLQLRVEVLGDACVQVLQCATPAQARFPEGMRTGTLVDLETVADPAPKDWSMLRGSLEGLHTASMKMFFEKVLTPDAIDKMVPEYGELADE